MTTAENYEGWSINDLFCELISYSQANIEDKATEAMKAAILAKSRAEGVERGARKERRRLKATRERYVEGVRFINDVGYYLIPLRAFRVSLAPKEKP